MIFIKIENHNLTNEIPLIYLLDENCFTYCTDWGYGPVVIAKELAQNQTISQARMLLNPLQPENVQAIILSQCDKGKLHLNCAANKHSNLRFSRIGASSKTRVIQTRKVSEHLKNSLILII